MPPPGYEPFLEMVLDNPVDDGPRMVYADWLEEQGDPRGEFIRVQLELARLTPTDPAFDRLTDREQSLLNRHGNLWRAEIPEWARNGCEFERGFVSQVTVWTPWRRGFGPQLGSMAPIQKVTLSSVKGTLYDFADGPELPHLTKLTVLDDEMTPDDLKVLCHSEETLRPLRSLLFMGMRLRDAGGLIISLCPYLEGLKHLELKRCALQHRGAAMLADTTKLPSLHWLDLSDNNIGNDVFWYLINSPLINRLTHLGWNDNGLTDNSVMALAESNRGSRLTYLELAGNEIGDRGARSLLKSCPDLTYLDVARNHFTNGMAMLLKQHYGPRVRLGLPGE